MHSILHSCVFPEGMDEHLPGGIHKVIETRKNFPRGAVIFFSDWYKNDKEEITEQYSISYRKWPKPRKRRTCDILFLTWSVLIKENKSCNIRSTYKISNSKLKQIKNLCRAAHFWHTSLSFIYFNAIVNRCCSIWNENCQNQHIFRIFKKKTLSFSEWSKVSK